MCLGPGGWPEMALVVGRQFCPPKVGVAQGPGVGCRDPCCFLPGGDAGGGRLCPGCSLRGHLSSPQQPPQTCFSGLEDKGSSLDEPEKGPPTCHSQCFMGD